jgi:hypothetical protein
MWDEQRIGGGEGDLESGVSREGGSFSGAGRGSKRGVIGAGAIAVFATSLARSQPENAYAHHVTSRPLEEISGNMVLCLEE